MQSSRKKPANAVFLLTQLWWPNLLRNLRDTISLWGVATISSKSQNHMNDLTRTWHNSRGGGHKSWQEDLFQGITMWISLNHVLVWGSIRRYACFFHQRGYCKPYSTYYGREGTDDRRGWMSQVVFLMRSGLIPTRLLNNPACKTIPSSSGSPGLME